RTPATIEYLRNDPMRSAIAVPIAIAGRPTSALILEASSYRSWSGTDVARLRLLAGTLAGALYRSRQEQALRYSRENVERLTALIQSESDQVRTEHGPETAFMEIIGSSQRLREALACVEGVAPTNSTVLLLGETGTGKELFARAIHRRSQRRASM